MFVQTLDLLVCLNQNGTHQHVHAYRSYSRSAEKLIHRKCLDKTIKQFLELLLRTFIDPTWEHFICHLLIKDIVFMFDKLFLSLNTSSLVVLLDLLITLVLSLCQDLALWTLHEFLHTDTWPFVSDFSSTRRTSPWEPRPTSACSTGH